jgi:hypothetical protein
VFGITVSSPEISYIEYTRMSPPIYQYVMNLFVILPIRSGPGVLMNVSVEEHCVLNNQNFYMAKFTILTPLSLVY